MIFRLVPKSVTLNDLELCVISPNLVAFGTDTIWKYLCVLRSSQCRQNTTLTSRVTTVTSAFAKNSYQFNSTYLRPLLTLVITFIYLPSDHRGSTGQNIYICCQWRDALETVINSRNLSDALGNPSTRRKRFIAQSGRLRHTSSDKNNTTHF